MKKSKWECTDPDMMQFCNIVVPQQIYCYIQVVFKTENDLSEGKYHTFSKEINVPEMSAEEIESAVSGHYESVEEVKKIYGCEAMQIIAECKFENDLWKTNYIEIIELNNEIILEQIWEKVLMELGA